MPIVQIRDVPEPEHHALKERAAANGQSVNSYVRELIRRDIATPTVAEVLQRAASRTERATASSLDAVRAARDTRTQQ